MGRKRNLSEKEKARIADLYQNTKMSIGAIASALELSTKTIQKYKDYKRE